MLTYKWLILWIPAFAGMTYFGIDPTARYLSIVVLEIMTERALENLPAGTEKLRLIADNGSQYVSREFQDYLRERDISHSKTRGNHPQINGKIERFHKSLNQECIRVTAMTDVEEVRRLIDDYVVDHNENRLHSALEYLVSADYLRGDEYIRRCLERRKEKLKAAARFRRISRRP